MSANSLNYINLRQDLNIGIEELFITHLNKAFYGKFGPSIIIHLLSTETSQHKLSIYTNQINTPHFLYGILTGLSGQQYMLTITTPSILFSRILFKERIFDQIAIDIGARSESLMTSENLNAITPDISFIYQLTVKPPKPPRLMILSIKKYIS